MTCPEQLNEAFEMKALFFRVQEVPGSNALS
jgi:hypothetical protein